MTTFNSGEVNSPSETKWHGEGGVSEDAVLLFRDLGGVIVRVLCCENVVVSRAPVIMLLVYIKKKI
jgi:hypothetical protein